MNREELYSELNNLVKRDNVAYVKKYAHLIPGCFDMRFLTQKVADKLAAEIDTILSRRK